MKQTLNLSSVTSADLDTKAYVTYNHKTESVDILANTFNVLKELYFFREENLNVDDSNSESTICEGTCFSDLPVSLCLSNLYIASYFSPRWNDEIKKSSCYCWLYELLIVIESANELNGSLKHSLLLPGLSPFVCSLVYTVIASQLKTNKSL